MVISVKGAALEPTCDCAHCRVEQLADALRLPARLDKAFRWYASLVVRAKRCRAELETPCSCGDPQCPLLDASDDTPLLLQLERARYLLSQEDR